jgi:hypothetical protein
MGRPVGRPKGSKSRAPTVEQLVRKQQRIVTRPQPNKPLRTDLRTEEQREHAVLLIVREAGSNGVRMRRMLEKLYLPKLPDTPAFSGPEWARFGLLLVHQRYDARTRMEWALKVRETAERLVREGKIIGFDGRGGFYRLRPPSRTEYAARTAQRNAEKWIAIIEQIVALVGAPDIESLVPAVEGLLQEREALRCDIERLQQQIENVERLHEEIVDMRVALATAEVVKELAAKRLDQQEKER